MPKNALFYLRPVTEFRLTHNYLLKEDFTTIGFGNSYDINLNNESKLLLCTIEIDGKIPIIYNYNSGGTFINGIKVKKYSKIIVELDLIAFGGHDYLYRLYSTKSNTIRMINLTKDPFNQNLLTTQTVHSSTPHFSHLSN